MRGEGKRDGEMSWRERELVQEMIKDGRSARKENLNEMIRLGEKLQK